MGFILAWALATGSKPAWLQNLVLSFSAVASQMGGVALAFAFIATLGVQGMATKLILADDGLGLE